MAMLSMIQFLFLGDSILDLGNTIDGWNGVSSSYNCDGTWITGGYGIFGQNDIGYKTFSLPQHEKLSVTVSLYALDSWDSEKAELKIDGQLKVSTTFQHDDGSDVWLCGSSSYGEHIYTYSSGFYSHTASSITIELQSFLDSPRNDESLGWLTKIQYTITQCFYFYTDYNYNGNQYQFCRKTPSEKQVDIPDEIKSFKIPAGMALILQGPDFQGGAQITYTTSQTHLSQSFKFPKYIMVP